MVRPVASPIDIVYIKCHIVRVVAPPQGHFPELPAEGRLPLIIPIPRMNDQVELRNDRITRVKSLAWGKRATSTSFPTEKHHNLARPASTKLFFDLGLESL